MIAFTKLFYLIFGLLTIFGGLMGYLKANSMASLIAGGISGLLLVVAWYLLPGQLNAGLILGLVVCVALAGKFIPDLLVKQVTPQGLLIGILSAAGIVLTITSWYKR